ncbi:transposase [Ralstonia pickettii]|uniref:transposase n=1 Tax=Ralstonia pickettii TaxID=329 RepID=UPI0020A678D4|nr:transposase [Ralstonia pickettii]
MNTKLLTGPGGHFSAPKNPAASCRIFSIYLNARAKLLAYATLRLRGDHVVVRKEKGKPVGRNHINGIEGFWSYAKNWLYPYCGVPSKFFHLYLGEICYRFNHRDEDLKPLLRKLLQVTPTIETQPILVGITIYFDTQAIRCGRSS